MADYPIRFSKEEPYQKFAPTAKVKVHRTAKVTLGQIDVNAHGTLIIGPETDVRNCRIVVSSGASLEIGEHSILEGANLLARQESAILRIGDHCSVAKNCLIMADNLIIIRNHVLIDMNSFIVDSTVHSLHWEERRKEIDDWHRNQKLENHSYAPPVYIEDDVWICYGATIAGAKTSKESLKLGRGLVVGANSVVQDSFDQFQLVAGFPARHVHYLAGSDKYDMADMYGAQNPINPSYLK